MNNYSELDVYKHTDKLNVLYVEDDERIRAETIDVLESFFHLVDSAIDGEDALQKYLKYNEENNMFYDLIITDLNMPKKDGQELISDIMNMNPNQAIIVISAHNESERLIELIQQGISNFVIKPIIPTQFMLTLYKTCKNVTNQKLKDQYIKDQTKMALVGEMIQNISHQWKQPLNTIAALSSLLIKRVGKENVSKEELQKHLEIILSQTDYLSETVDVFRDFMKEDKVYKTVVLQDRLLKALNIVKLPLIDNFISLHIDIDENNPIDITMTTGELSQVLINIINNAKDALLEKKIFNPWIKVALRQENSKAIISIEDNAGGIPTEVMGKIFDQYFTTKGHTHGTGIGLYMSKNIINCSLKGEFYVENSANGAKFFIEIPIEVD